MTGCTPGAESPPAGSGAEHAERGGPPAALEARRVTLRYGSVAALEDVSVTVAPGECLALVGESGSGKTTLLRCFNALARPDAGEVLVGGREVGLLDPIELRRRTGYVPQEGGLLPHWRVGRNVELVPRLLRLAEASRLAAAALELAGLDPHVYGKRWPRELSGGQRQRVAIARALAARPSVLLLDEPFGALDAITRTELQDAFDALRRALAVTAVLVTHDLHEAARLADRIAVLRAGRLEQVAAPGELTAAPATPYVERLVARSRLSQAGPGP